MPGLSANKWDVWREREREISKKNGGKSMENGRRGEVIVYINISFFTTVSPRNATLKELEVKSILLESPVIPTLSSSTLSIGLLGVSALLGTSAHGGVLYRILAIASNRAASASSAATRSSSLNLSFSSCLCFRASALSRFCSMSCSCLLARAMSRMTLSACLFSAFRLASSAFVGGRVVFLALGLT